MSRIKNVTSGLTLTAVGLITASGAFGQSWTEIGADLDVSNMSADGSIIVGNMLSGGSYYWTESGGLVLIGGGYGSPAISADGSMIVGREFSDVDGKEEAAIWLGGMDWQLLGNVPGGESCDNFRSSAWGVSGDGSHLVGLAWVPNCRAHGFVYDDVNGMVDLGSTVVDRSSRANGISDDDLVIIGWQDATDGFRQGARWIDGDQTVFEFDGFPVGEAQDTNSDGSVIVGSSALGQGWRWTEATGVEQTGVLPGFNYNGFNIGCSEDGNVVGGFSGFGFDRIGHVWTPDTGIMRADDYLADNGVDVPDGFGIAVVTAVSADGKTIAGWGFDTNFRIAGWVATTGGDAPLELAVDPLIAGEKTTFKVTGADPNQRIILCYSTTGLGETVVPEMNVTLDLDGARLVKMHPADADGNAMYSRKVPSNWAGTEVWFQAAVNSRTSDVVSEIIQ